MTPKPRTPLRWTAVALLALLASGCVDLPYDNVSSVELQQLIDQGIPVIDIRTPGEWRETGIVPGSHTITFFDSNGRVNPRFFEQLQGVVNDPAQPVALICRTGNRTTTVSRILVEDLGFQKVYNVERGITDWIGRRNPVTRG